MKNLAVLTAGCCTLLTTTSSSTLPPNEMGHIPILEYHIIGSTASTNPNVTQWFRPVDRFKQDLETLYARGYRPISISQLVDKKIDLPAGLSPVVFTFDDAPPEQFRFIEQNGK